MGERSRTCCRGADGLGTIVVGLGNADRHSERERKSKLVLINIFCTECSHNTGSGGRGSGVWGRALCQVGER